MLTVVSRDILAEVSTETSMLPASSSITSETSLKPISATVVGVEESLIIFEMSPLYHGYNVCEVTRLAIDGTGDKTLTNDMEITMTSAIDAIVHEIQYAN